MTRPVLWGFGVLMLLVLPALSYGLVLWLAGDRGGAARRVREWAKRQRERQ